MPLSSQCVCHTSLPAEGPLSDLQKCTLQGGTTLPLWTFKNRGASRERFLQCAHTTSHRKDSLPFAAESSPVGRLGFCPTLPCSPRPLCGSQRTTEAWGVASGSFPSSSEILPQGPRCLAWSPTADLVLGNPGPTFGRPLGFPSLLRKPPPQKRSLFLPSCF